MIGTYALVLGVIFCATFAAFLGLVHAYQKAPKPEPSPRDLDRWDGDYPVAEDLDAEERRRLFDA